MLEREVRANLVYRAFTRIGDEKVPDAKTLARLGQLIGPKVIEELHGRVVELARERGVTQGRKLRVDTTVVESNIHYPTDSSLLGDGTRVLTRTMKKIESKSGGLKRKVRDQAWAAELCVGGGGTETGTSGFSAKGREDSDVGVASVRGAGGAEAIPGG